jgi:hypothetical protein
MQDLSAIDPTASLVETLTPNGYLIPQDEYGLHNRVVFLADERERVEKYLAAQIKATRQNYTNVWAKRAENIKAYEAISDKGEAITLPVSRAQVNQQHAWLIERVFDADPVISIRPLGDGDWPILSKDKDTGLVQPAIATSSDVAADSQALIHYKWTYRLPMRKVLSDWLMEALIDGTVPAVVKLVHDDYSYQVTDRGEPQDKLDPLTKEPVTNARGQRVQIIDAPQYRTVHAAESVQIANVPGDMFLVPFGHLDIQRAPWIEMVTEPPTSQIRQNFSGEKPKYNFCTEPGTELDPAEVEAVLYAAEVDDEAPKRGRRAVNRIDKRVPIDPAKTHTVGEVFFRWPILSPENPNVIEWHELVGEFHEKTGKLLCCSTLDTWNGQRPFIDYFQRQRPNAYSGTSTNEDVAPFQRYMSNLFHLQVQNMVMRNVSVFFVRKGSSSHTFLKGKSLRPGDIVPFDDAGDIEAKPLGTPIESIASEISFLKTGAVEMGLSTQYDSATADLSRVTAGAFQQQQDLSKMQPKQIYATFAGRVGALALAYLQTLIQYAPEQTIPSFGSKSDSVLARVIQLPRIMVTDQFAFGVTATTSDQTPEAMLQEDLMLMGEIDKRNGFAMTMLGQITMPGTLPEFQEIGTDLIARGELMLESMFKNARRHDASKFVLSPEKIKKMLASLQARAAGVMNGGPVPNAIGGGGVPGAPVDATGSLSIPQQPSPGGFGPPNQGADLQPQPASVLG